VVVVGAAAAVCYSAQNSQVFKLISFALKINLSDQIKLYILIIIIIIIIIFSPLTPCAEHLLLRSLSFICTDVLQPNANTCSMKIQIAAQYQ